MEEELAFPLSRSGSLDNLWVDRDEEVSPSKQPGENGSKYILAGEGEGAITCTVSVDGDYLRVTGALREVVTDALRELADVSAKDLEGKGKLGTTYTMITRRGRGTGKLRRWIEQKDKKDRVVKRKAPDVSRAFEVITLAKAAHEASNVSYKLWGGGRGHGTNGAAPKRQKVEEEVDYGNHENNNNYESGHEKAIKALKTGHKDAIAQLRRSQEEAIQRVRKDLGKRVDELIEKNQLLEDRNWELEEALVERYEEEL